MLSGISQRRTKPYDFTCMWILKNKTNEHMKQKQTHREQTDFQRGRGWGDG